jgi:hypothetical protein
MTIDSKLRAYRPDITEVWWPVQDAATVDVPGVLKVRTSHGWAWRVDPATEGAHPLKEWDGTQWVLQCWVLEVIDTLPPLRFFDPAGLLRDINDAGSFADIRAAFGAFEAYYTVDVDPRTSGPFSVSGHPTGGGVTEDQGAFFAHYEQDFTLDISSQRDFTNLIIDLGHALSTSDFSWNVHLRQGDTEIANWSIDLDGNLTHSAPSQLSWAFNQPASLKPGVEYTLAVQFLLADLTLDTVSIAGWNTVLPSRALRRVNTDGSTDSLFGALAFTIGSFVEYTALDDSDLANAKDFLATMSDEISKYPGFTFAEIHLVKNVTTTLGTPGHTSQAAGLYINDGVFFELQDYVARKAAGFYPIAIHHELWHYLDHAIGITSLPWNPGLVTDFATAWNACNPPGFVWDSQDVAFTGAHPEGFTRAYSRTNIAEDTADFHSYMMSEPGHDLLTRWAADDAYLAAKMVVYKNWWAPIGGGIFTGSYWEDINR